MTGCATPGERFISDAVKAGFEQDVLTVNQLPLVIFHNQIERDSRILHIYLDGDGSPWASRTRIAQDPSSRHRIVLQLMQADPHPAVLIGRPCYYRQTSACEPSLWTDARYSQTVVETMATAIEDVRDQEAREGIRLIGYSGGGALAMLLAARLTEVRQVITIAANLDIEAWTARHGYSPLSSSLNPARQPPLDSSIKQSHFVGGQDENVPRSISESTIAMQPNAELIAVPNYGHACCWPEDWTSRLEAVLEN